MENRNGVLKTTCKHQILLAFGQKHCICYSRCTDNEPTCCGNLFSKHSWFKNGRESVQDYPRTGRPSTAFMKEYNIPEFAEFVRTNRRQTISIIVEKEELCTAGCGTTMAQMKTFNERSVFKKCFPQLYLRW